MSRLVFQLYNKTEDGQITHSNWKSVEIRKIREKFGDCPLHRNAPISTAGSLLIILSFANRNKITGKALSGFKLISLHCPVEYHYADFP